jgi:toxin ParE1/3/4
MKIEYSNRATADLRKVSADSRVFGAAVTAAVEARIRGIVSHIAEHPEAATRVAERPGVHVVPLIRYPCKIFYRLLEDRVRIIHIRHTSRRPWTRDR